MTTDKSSCPCFSQSAKLLLFIVASVVVLTLTTLLGACIALKPPRSTFEATPSPPLYATTVPLTHARTTPTTPEATASTPPHATTAPLTHARTTLTTSEATASTLLYVDENGNLWLHDVATEQRVPLTEDGNTVKFSLSPTSDRIVHWDSAGRAYLLILDFRAGDTLHLSTEPLGRLQDQPRWSPDGAYLYYLDDREQAWILDQAGRLQQLSFSAGPSPRWSFVDHYLAYIEDGRLWVASLDGKQQEIAENIETIYWSPTQLLLAYETISTVDDPGTAAEPEGHTTSVYDVATSQGYLITLQGRVWNWMPDGQALGIFKLDSWGVSGFSYTLFVGDPYGQALLEVQAVHSTSIIRLCPALDTWLIGPWEIRRDLGGKETVIDFGYPIDWTPDGRQALVLDGDWGTYERHLYYLDRQADIRQLVISDHGEIGHADNPGMWGNLSPLSTRALVRITRANGTKELWLIRSDGKQQTQLAHFGWAVFSADDRWLLGRNSDDWMLYDTMTDVYQALDTASDQEPVWLLSLDPAF